MYKDEDDEIDPYSDKVPQRLLEGQSEIIIEEKLELRFSKTNNICLFRNVLVQDRKNANFKRFSVYRSNETAENFIAAINRV